MIYSHVNTFPQQRVDGSIKSKADWYANCIDYIIDAGLSFNDKNDTELKLGILRGDLPNEFYKKTLNPYNSNNERYKRFPATLRNLDIMSDIIRRYVSEYFKGIHEFVVGANNPNIVINKNTKLKEKIGQLAQQAFQQEFEKQYQSLLQQAQENGQDPNTVDPQQAMPDPEQFVQEFNEQYIDEESKQAQDILDYIRSLTQDNIIYLSAFFNYCALGECYSYSDIRGNNIYKENVPVLEAYPIPNDKYFVEDHDMFARRMLMSYQQIIDMFDSFLDDKDRKFLETYYGRPSFNSGVTRLSYTQMFENYADVCDKFTKEEREIFKKEPVSIHAENGNLFEVWHVVWRGEAKQGILTYINDLGFETTRVVEEDYELNKEAGDISIEWVYKPQVYEGYRIGTRYNSVYPMKARPIAFNRNGKLPYNGIMEVLPMMGKFSIIKLVTPYQVMRNIFAYHREMVIAKNKMLILLMPESLIASDTEDKIYKMAADGILLVDDTEDTNSLKMQQIRLLNANMGDYITQLTNLMESTKLEAREMVDMNMQRYGDIAQSAGAATTQEAITRSSMGMVILVQMFDEFRKADYNRDLDYSKLAFIEGLDTSYWDELGKRRFISLDINNFVNSEYSTTVRNDAKELDKINQLRQWAFSAAQNGNLDMALAAISGDNVSQIKATIEKFNNIKRQHEKQMQQIDQMMKQEEIQAKLQEIAAKGEQDRLTQQLKYFYELQLKHIDVDMSMLAADTSDASTKNRLAAMAEDNKRNLEQQRIQLEREKLMADTYSKAADREVKRHQIDTELKIAKTNKNRYDK
ncbi:MAG: putative portal protein [crAssphage sp. isolate ctcc615]|uniref:Portal protein n=1 Tax=crAssphage sp. isolate ctcc615 TaxID=2989853 RepID=A0A345BP23_9CAUD|nr:MAG: portal protein [crAssphage sp. isolate ctcc615]AXF52194.1 MAG: putative portal protein [crAssphage sp. isolate ctcc615]